MMSHRALLRNTRCFVPLARSFMTNASESATNTAGRANPWSAFAFLASASTATIAYTKTYPSPAQCDVRRNSSLKPLSGEVVMLGPTKEPSTGILFPQLCNGMTFVGCGVRIKYMFVKVYAVGTYVDPIAMSAIKKEGPEAISKALLDPMYPRTIRIVMNRGLSVEKFTKAIVEALEPRMNGQDLDTLDQFMKMNPPGDLVEGAEMEITIRGDNMLYKNSAGGVGSITSAVFCKAMCDVYYGEDAVSVPHKEATVEGIQKL